METNCIEFSGAINRLGYGMKRFKGKTWGAHRWAWTINVGEIPLGLNVLHKCDNPPCINIKHLYLGTLKDNMRDRLVRGRNPQANKTQCIHGHEYTEENTLFQKGNKRLCRECNRIRCRRDYLKRKYR